MFCENCGKEIKDENKFCPYCGASVQPEQNGEQPEEEYHDRSHDEGEQSGEKCLDEIHDAFRILCVCSPLGTTKIMIFPEKQIKFIVFR